MIPIGIFILTAYRGIEFDGSSRVFREYNSFLLFMKFGKWEKYKDVEKIYVNSSNVSQKIYTMITHGMTAKNVEYSAYMKIHDSTKLFLASNRNKKMLFRKMAALADFFQLEIIDNTEYDTAV